MRRRFFNSRINNKIIIYTSLDNLIVMPYKYDFGATIIKNTINNNIGMITFDRSVTIIGDRAFYNCYRLASIQIPDSVTSIGDCAFYGCSSLASIQIPDSVTSIGYDAFDDCTSLTSIQIGNSVTSIGVEVFNGCTGLKSVYVKATTPPTLGGGIFGYNSSNPKIYVPRASLNAYKTARGWSNYASDIEPYDFDGGGSATLITFYIDDGGGM